ncbi:MAG: tripartite tricarboxylate transporter substrate binding protein [Parvularculales bacterium]
MKHMIKLVIMALSIAVAFSGLSSVARAEYPDKPVTLVVPYGPGGAADLAARIMSSTATASLGSNILVVNRTGASGVTGSAFVTKSKPDGYTLLMARVGSQAAVPALNPNIPYKWDDFTFLGLIELNPFALTVNAESRFKTYDDLIKAIKAGEKISYSSAGVGTLPHLGMVVFLDKLGLDQDALTHVPFKGGGAAATALTGNHVDVFFQNLSGVIGGIQGGKLRALALTTPERVASVPDVPTFAEVGEPEMEAILGWTGVWGPKNLPDEVVDKWVGVLETLSKDRAWLKLTKGLGSIPQVLKPKPTREFVKNQYETFKDTIERVGMTISN